MKVSVVIPTYNRGNHVVRAVESVIAQSYKDYEIIVVDDGSSDQTKALLEPYSDCIRYVHQSNAGPASARNNGIRMAVGEWMAFLDSDDVWAPNKLERQLSQCIGLNADLSFHDLSFPSFYGRDISSWNEYVHKEYLRTDCLKTGILDDAYHRMMTTAHIFLTTTFLAKRRAICDVGCFNEAFRTSEDLDLYFRLAARFRVAYVAEALAVYTPGSHRVTDSERIHRDRIHAIRRSLEDRLKNQDMTLAYSAREGLLQEVRSLAGFYRKSGSYCSTLRTYANYFLMRLASFPRLLAHASSNAFAARVD